jgi:hypothetical protein
VEMKIADATEGATNAIIEDVVMAITNIGMDSTSL